MKKFLIGLCFVILCSCKAYSQDYKTHKVKEGETIESIAKEYLVTYHAPKSIVSENGSVRWLSTAIKSVFINFYNSRK